MGAQRYSKQEEKYLIELMKGCYEEHGLPQKELIPTIESAFREKFSRKVNGLNLIHKYHRMRKKVKEEKKSIGDGRPYCVLMVHNGSLDSGKMFVCKTKEHLERQMGKCIEEHGYKVPEHTIFTPKKFEIQMVEVEE